MKHRGPRLLVALSSLVALVTSGVDGGQPVDQGFGAVTSGGRGGHVVRVANLNDTGSGSLREALAGDNRIIVFDVAGEILLQSHLFTKAFVTIDGFSAPPPGITLRNYGIVIRGNRGAHDVIVRGLRIRNPSIDGIQISYGAYRVVVDHVSISGTGDGAIDITAGSRDVTVSWSILAHPASGKTMLIKYKAARITLHHNAFVRGLTRNPNVGMGKPGTPARTTTLDMRNNVVWDWGEGWGTLVHNGAHANIVGNFYASPGSSPHHQARALVVERASPDRPSVGGRAYVSGNVSGDGLGRDLNAEGTEARPFEAPPVETQDACTAARHVAAQAGVHPRDAVDAAYVAPIVVGDCAGPAS